MLLQKNLMVNTSKSTWQLKSCHIHFLIFLIKPTICNLKYCLENNAKTDETTKLSNFKNIVSHHYKKRSWLLKALHNQEHKWLSRQQAFVIPLCRYKAPNQCSGPTKNFCITHLKNVWCSTQHFHRCLHVTLLRASKKKEVSLHCR